MSNKGEVTYEVRADYSHLDEDLDAAQKKVEKSNQKVANTSEKCEENTAKAKKETQEDVTRHHKKENDKREEDDKDSHKQREEDTKKHGEKLKSITSGTAKAIGAGMLAVGTAAVAIGTMATNSAVSMDKAMNDFIASTGKGTEETERYQKVLEEVYKNNYGEDFQDISDAMEVVTKNLGDMDDSQLQAVTESAFALRDVFEYDLAESTRAAKAMMDQFGISGEEAMGLIAAGANNGLDYSGELLDSISEYSVQFAKVGLGAEDMFKIFQKGAETGAWNLDKVGDAIKEMSIRVIDGSESTKGGFEAIGLNADNMASKFAAGGESAKEAFQQTLEALASLENPLAQDAAGVALFGTMWEDLGPEVVTQLANIKDGAYDASDAMNSIKGVKYDDLGSMFEGLKRSVEMLLLPLGEQLIPVLSELIMAIMPIVEDALPPFIEFIGQLISELKPVIEEILPVLLDLFSGIAPPLMDLISAILPTLVDLFNELIPPIVELIGEALPVLVELIEALLPIALMLIESFMPLIDCFLQLLPPILLLISEALVPLLEAITPIISTINDVLIPILQFLVDVFAEVFNGILDSVTSYVSKLANMINSIVDFIKNVFTGNWKEAWKNVRDIFKNAFGMMVDYCKAPLNMIIDLINGFIKGINKLKLPDWVPGIGGKNLDIPTIPKLRVGMEYVPNDDFPAILHKGEAVLTAQENALYRSVGGFQGVMQTISERGYQDSQINIQPNVTVEGIDIDYERMGETVYAAFKRHGMTIKVNNREVGRVMEEISKGRGR